MGVQNVISCSNDDPEHLLRMQQAQKDFQDREANRLNKLQEMDRSASTLLQDRQARRSNFEMSMISGADEHRKRQEAIFQKMREDKERKRLEKKELRKKEGA